MLVWLDVDVESVEMLRATVWPSATLAMSVVSTDRSTVYLPVLTTWICAVEVPLDELFEPVWPLPVDEPTERGVAPPPVPEPLTDVPLVPPLPSCCPTVRFIAVTVPSVVAFSEAPSSAAEAATAAS